MHGNQCFLFNSFISELEAGRGSMGVSIAGGAQPGGATSRKFAKADLGLCLLLGRQCAVARAR